MYLAATFHNLAETNNFIQTSPNKTFNCCIPKRIKYIARLRLGISHLWEHKFKHCFQDTLNPSFDRDPETEKITHYLLLIYFPTSQNETLNLLRKFRIKKFEYFTYRRLISPNYSEASLW